jgi:hypothetical protein
MKLSDLRFNVHESGAWTPVLPEDAKAPYITFEQRAIEPGETYPVKHPSGMFFGQKATYPAGQKHKIIRILHQPDGTTQESLHYGHDHTPVDSLPGVDQ